jgi:predicted DNA binding CopG/RHH family protein
MKKKTRKTKKVTVRFIEEEINFVKEVVDMTSLSFNQVVNVLLAAYLVSKKD